MEITTFKFLPAYGYLVILTQNSLINYLDQLNTNSCIWRNLIKRFPYSINRKYMDESDAVFVKFLANSIWLKADTS